MNRMRNGVCCLFLVLCVAQISQGKDQRCRRRSPKTGWLSQSVAREIMGKNYFGIEEASKYFGVHLSKQQFTALKTIPFSRAELEAKKNTHILVALFPLSILEIRSKVSEDQRLFYDEGWYNGKSFAKVSGAANWQLVRKTPVPNSTGIAWEEQQALVAQNKEETPTARVMVYVIIGHYLATGERMFQRIYVRCSDVDSGVRILVGAFDSLGLSIDYELWEGAHSGNIGVSSARKFD